MNNQLKKGILEMAILGFLKEEELYGYLIIKKVEKYIKIKESSIYIVLTRLAQANYLDIREESKGKRIIKHYKLNEAGIKYLSTLKEQWDEINLLVEAAKINE